MDGEVCIFVSPANKMQSGMIRKKAALQPWRIRALVIFIGLYFFCIFAVADCEPSANANSGNEETMVRICGRELINVLKGLCKNCFRGTNVQPPEKRTSSSWHLLANEASLLTSRFRRASGGGIATECCERQCSYGYLKSFCLPEAECSATSG